MLPTTKIILLCALLLPLIDAAYSKSTRHRNPLVRNNENNCGDNDKALVCKANNQQDLLQVNYDASVHVLIVTNVTEKGGIVFDINKRLVALFCNQTPLIIIIKYDEGCGVLLQGQSLPLTPKQICLDTLYEQGTKSGTTFKVSSAPPDVWKYGRLILESVSRRCDTNPLRELIRLSNLLETALTCECSKIIPSLQSPIVFGYEKLISRLKAVVELFELCNKLDKCTINIGAVFYEPRGVDVIKSLMNEVSKCTDVEQIFGNCLNTPECLIPLLNELEGNTTVGYGGLLHVVSAATKNCSREIPAALVQYYANPQENRADNCKRLKSDVDDLHDTAKKHNPKGFVGLTTFRQNITSDTWKRNGIDYSNMTNALGQCDSRGGLWQMTSMGPIMGPFMSINVYIVRIFQQFTTMDIRQVPNIIPGFDIGGLIGPIFSILGGFIRFPLTFLQYIEQAVESGLLQMAEFWKLLPILGPIIALIEQILAYVLHLVLGNLLHADEVQPLLRETALGLVQEGDPNGYGLSFSGEEAAAHTGLFSGPDIFHNFVSTFPNVYGSSAPNSPQQPCNDSTSVPPGGPIPPAGPTSSSGSSSSVVQSLEHAVLPLGKKKGGKITDKHKGENSVKHEKREKHVKNEKRDKHEKHEKREKHI